MKNSQSISDFVAAQMDATLKSVEHNKLFGTRYKTASDESKESEDCSLADDDDARKKKKKEEEEESSSSSSSDSSSAHDHLGLDDSFKEQFPEAYEYLKMYKMKHKFPSAHEVDLENRFPSTSSLLNEGGPEDVALAFDTAIDSLLVASAALDSIGMEKTSALSLKLASFVVEAKKKDPGKDKEKQKAAKEKELAAKQKAKEKAEKDSQSAKDKAAKDKEKEKAAKEKAKEKAEADKAKEKVAKEKEKAKAEAAKKAKK